jgi:hypothetical protein
VPLRCRVPTTRRSAGPGLPTDVAHPLMLPGALTRVSPFKLTNSILDGGLARSLKGYAGGFAAQNQAPIDGSNRPAWQPHSTMHPPRCGDDVAVAAATRAVHVAAWPVQVRQ